MKNTREHIIFFIAQKMFNLERSGHVESYRRLIDVFEQIDLDRLIKYLTRYYEVDIEREMDDFFLEQGELVFITRGNGHRYKHIYRAERLSLIGIECLDEEERAS